MIEALKEAGGKPKYTEYPGVGHNSWDKAYGTDELYDVAAEAAARSKSISDASAEASARRFCRSVAKPQNSATRDVQTEDSSDDQKSSQPPRLPQDDGRGRRGPDADRRAATPARLRRQRANLRVAFLGVGGRCQQHIDVILQDAEGRQGRRAGRRLRRVGRRSRKLGNKQGPRPVSVGQALRPQATTTRTTSPRTIASSST